MSTGEIQHLSGSFEWTVHGMNILIGGVAFCCNAHFYLHNLDFYPDVRLVILSSCGRHRFQVEPLFFYARKKQKQPNKQTKPAPGPESRSHYESQSAHFQIQQATELKTSPGE